jgi:hypothetical protein
MVYIKWFFILAFWAVAGAFLHYTLPQVDIARITDTYEKRETPSTVNSIFWGRGDAGSATDPTGRDVFFIQTRLADDGVMVYRNEDTGWGWPPYFKFDTSNLQAEAADQRSTAEAPKYVAIRHYGWRVEFLSIFPNAVALWPVDGPDVSKPLPWFNIVVLGLLTVFGLAIRNRWRRFREARLDPKFEEWQDSWEATEDAIAARRGRLRRWWARQRG